MSEAQRWVLRVALRCLARRETERQWKQVQEQLEKEKVQPAATSEIGSSNDEEALFKEGMQRLLQCSSEMANASDQNSLFSALEKMSASDPGMNEFMNAMMSTVLSKDFMYPPLQSLLEKFGPYLEENKGKLSEEDLSKYQHQQEVIEKRQFNHGSGGKIGFLKRKYRKI